MTSKITLGASISLFRSISVMSRGLRRYCRLSNIMLDVPSSFVPSSIFNLSRALNVNLSDSDLKAALSILSLSSLNRQSLKCFNFIKRKDIYFLLKVPDMPLVFPSSEENVKR